MALKHFFVGGAVLVTGAIGCAQDFESLFADGGNGGAASGACPSDNSGNCTACLSGPNTCSCTFTPASCDTECTAGPCETTCNLSTGCSMKCAAGQACLLRCPFAPLLAPPYCTLTCGDDGAIAPQRCGDHGIACNPVSFPGKCD